MRIYTANGLRVKITGFFQEIITPGNKTQDFAKYLFNPVTDTGNTSGTTTGTGTVPGVHVLFLVGGGNLHRPNTSNYMVKI